MATIIILCPECQQDKVIKFGKSPEGKQRYRCLSTKCKKNTFIRDYSYNGHKPGTRKNYCDGIKRQRCSRYSARFKGQC